VRRDRSGRREDETNVAVDGRTSLDGRYALEQVIGSGGMADVYRATDRLLSRPVAVKVLRDVAATESERARFAAEARTLARLSHPGLVTVLDAGSTGDRPYLVMELIDGPSLAAAGAGPPLDAATVAGIGAQVADALAYVHGAGVVHRDVKPANILLGGDGRAWLGDFGIARLMADTARHTSTGLVVGTASYLAPEQLRGDQVTPAADVYALGLVMLEALTGAPAYPGTGLEAAMARLSRPPEIPTRLPDDWLRLLRAMTETDAPARPSAADVAATLRRMPLTMAESTPANDGQRVPAAAHPGTQVLTEAVQPSSSSQRLRWVGAAIAAGAVVVVGGVVVAQADGGGGGAAHRVEMPTDVPPRLQQPLQELHDALNGDNQ
jgi:eukaryotic-like serine/threonine-protein kinase